MDLETISQIITGLVVAFVIWLWRNNQNRIDKVENGITNLRKDFNDNRVRNAEHFTTKEEIHDLENKILNRLQTLEDKIDRVLRINGSGR